MSKPPIRAASSWRPPARPPRADERRGTAEVRLEVFDCFGTGPEDVAVDADGFVFAGLVDGRIVRFTPDGRLDREVARTGGRPLGVEIDPDGELRVCDARLGVLHVNPSTGKVTSLVDRIAGAPMKFCNNGAFGADGTMYFTDSSAHFGVEYWKGELLAHTGTGRLLRRTADGAVDLVADGFQFANGVALAPDQSWVAVAQTGGYSLDRIWLTGPDAGRREVFVDNLPGFPDNISTGSDGLIWVALPSPRDAVLDLLLPRPPVLRKLAWAMPEALQPKPKKTVWVQAYAADGTLVHDLQTEHPDFWMATGVRESGGVVWLGSLAAPTIARIALT
jgi:sugar lactone lactonase YvrE